MGLEYLLGGSTYLDSLDPTNPVGTVDTLAQTDDHLRGIKNVILNTFPNLTAAMSCTASELNIFAGAGVTSLGIGGGLDADRVDGFEAAAVAAPNILLALDATGVLNVDLIGNVLGNVEGDLTGTADNALLLEGQNLAYVLNGDNHTNKEPLGALTVGTEYLATASGHFDYSGNNDAYYSAYVAHKIKIPYLYTAGTIRIEYKLTSGGAHSRLYIGLNGTQKHVSSAVIEGAGVTSSFDLAVSPGDTVDIRIGQNKDGVLSPSSNFWVAYGVAETNRFWFEVRQRGF